MVQARVAGQGREVREPGAKGVVQVGLPARGRAGVWPEMQVFLGTTVLPILRPGALVAAGCRQQGLLGLLVFQ